jgi:HK97 family phage portal protein
MVHDFQDPMWKEFIGGAIANRAHSGAAVTPHTAMSIAVAWRCVSLISGLIGSLPLTLRRRVNENTTEEAREHPLWILLRRRPNRWQTPKMFKQMLQVHLQLRGNAYVMIVRSLGKVVALIPLMPDRIETKQGADMLLSYVYTRADGRQVTLRQDEVLHLRGMSFDGIRGLPVLTYARHSMGISLEAERAAGRVFEHGNLAGGYFAAPKGLSETAYGRLKVDLKTDFMGGVDSMDQVQILEEGIEWKPIGMTAEDAQFLQTRDWERTEVGMFFGVPPHLYGDVSKNSSWGTGVEQMTIGFVVYTFYDWVKTWEEGLDFSLLTERELDLYHHINLNALLRGDTKSRYEAYQIGRNGGWLSANDIRRSEDMNPLPEGGDEYLVPMNNRPAGGQANDPDPSEAAAGRAAGQRAA